LQGIVDAIGRLTGNILELSKYLQEIEECKGNYLDCGEGVGTLFRLVTGCTL
jgi:hypothetical protein